MKRSLVFQPGFSSAFETPDRVLPVTIHFRGQRRNQVFRLCFV